MAAPTTCYIGLGSNLDEPRQQLDRACRALGQLPASQLIRCSSYYTTKAIGPGCQPDYQNAVAELTSALSPLELLDQLQRIEQSQGRQRSVRWGARTLDLDLLLYGQLSLDSARLTLPHPRLHERRFVLEPLLEIAPQLALPERGSAAQLLAKLD